MENLETRVAVLEARMDGMNHSTDRTLDTMKGRFDRIESQFDAVDRRLGSVESQFAALDANMERRFGELAIRFEERFTAIHHEFAIVHREIARQTKFLIALALGSATFVSVIHPLVQKLLR